VVIGLSSVVLNEMLRNIHSCNDPELKPLYIHHLVNDFVASSISNVTEVAL